ncbi:MAG: hypothetical protein K8R87_03575, partial [Verrucomicrobia bacterium]|nr:hypothetical protein [Verrucomicrobiota bacterium]
VPNKPGTPPPGATGGSGGSTPPPPLQVFQGVVPLIRGLTVINRNSFIKVDPQIKAFNLVTNTILLSDGTVYHPAKDGPFAYFGFGATKVSDPDLQGRLAEKGDWVAYKFEELLINGTPDIGDFFPSPRIRSAPRYGPSFYDLLPRNVIFSAINDITLANNDALPDDYNDPGDATGSKLDLNNFDSVLLYTQNGSILLEEGFNIVSDKDGGQDISLVSAGATSDITIHGDIEIYAARLLISAGHDLLVDGNVTADDITFRAGNDVKIDGAYDGEGSNAIEAQKGNILVSAKKNIKITNSSQLKALAQLSPDGLDALIRLESLEGEITIDGNSTIDGTNIEIEAKKGAITIANATLGTTNATNALKVRMGASTGTLTIGGTRGPTTLNARQLIHLYAEGISSPGTKGADTNGKIYFAGPTSFGGGGHLDIAAKTVEIKGGVNVNVSGTSVLHVFTDNQLYNGGTYGNFVRGSTQDGNRHPSGYAGRPAFGTSH